LQLSVSFVLFFLGAFPRNTRARFRACVSFSKKWLQRRVSLSSLLRCALSPVFFLCLSRTDRSWSSESMFLWPASPSRPPRRNAFSSFSWVTFRGLMSGGHYCFSFRTAPNSVQPLLVFLLRLLFFFPYFARLRTSPDVSSNLPMNVFGFFAIARVSPEESYASRHPRGQG